MSRPAQGMPRPRQPGKEHPATEEQNMKNRFMMLVLVLGTVLALCPVSVFAANAAAAINSTNFPDDNFRVFVSRYYDKNNDGRLSATELNNVKEMDLTGESGIASLKGIEFFDGLTTLNCAGIGLTSLDLSRNRALRTLNCSGNLLTSLDLRANGSLLTLSCGDNRLTSLDISKCYYLNTIDCSGNDLDGLYLGDPRPYLHTLHCSGNRISALNITNCYFILCAYQKAEPVTDGGRLVYEHYEHSEEPNYSGSGSLIIDPDTAVVTDVFTGWTDQAHYLREGIPATGWYYTDYITYAYAYGLYFGDKLEGWYYFDENGETVTGLQKILSFSYYFSDRDPMGYGWMVTDCMIRFEEGLRYFRENGTMAIGWMYCGTEIGYGLYSQEERCTPDTWYYFDESGIMATGLQTIGGKTFLFEASGGMATGWRMIDAQWYYFSPAGEMAKGWVKDRGRWYYFNEDGTMQTGWQQIGGKWYYFTEDGVMQTGWQDIGRHRYWFNPSGAMQTGWKQINRTWYWFNPSGGLQTGWQQIDGKWYCFDETGAMQTGWQLVDGAYYWFSPSGVMATGWKQIDGCYFWFGSSGVMQTGWRTIDGARYYFGTNGLMATGWKTIGGKTYYFKNSGAMAANEWCGGWWLNADGTWTYPNKASWKKDAKGWWFGDGSGWYARNTTITIDGKAYTFDAEGYWAE